MSRLPNRRRSGPSVQFNGEIISVESRGRTLTVTAAREAEDELLVPLDDVAAWDDGAELAIEDLQRILEAIEAEADEQGLSLTFD